MSTAGTRWVFFARLIPVLAAVMVMMGACRDAPRSAAPPSPPTQTTPAQEETGELHYHEGALPERAKIFLVAGGHDSANFAQEIVDQRRLWMRAGFDEDEIVCYWAKPTPRAYSLDRAQYQRLADELRSCYRASPRLLRTHLDFVARRQLTNDDLPFLYLYVSSHGSRSVLGAAKRSKNARIRKTAAGLTACEQEIVDTHAMILAGDRTGALHFPSIVGALREGEHPDELFLTPRGLQRTLHAFDPAIPKIVVLQGCYTGGFIGRNGQRRSRDGLAVVPNLTLLTAARHDRASFGCQPGSERTEFGRAYLRVLSKAANLHDPTRVAWRSVYTRTRLLVERREKGRHRTHSHPRFIKNVRRAKVPLPPVADQCTPASRP